MKNVSSGITACFGDATPARRPVPSTRTRYATRIPVFPNIARWLGGPTWKTRTGKPMAGGAGRFCGGIGPYAAAKTHPIKALALLFVLGSGFPYK